MPIKKRARTTLSFAIKKKGKFKPLPRLSEKQKRDVVLGKGKFKKLPSIFVIKKRSGRVIKAQKL